jgi:hypothetical protein
MILTQFGDLPETPLPVFGLSSHVIRHKHHHALSSTDEGGIGVEIGTRVTRQQKCLRMGHQPKRMRSSKNA